MDDAKQAAYSAVYGTGQGNQKSYEYNSDCKECKGTLDGAEYETGDQGIQTRKKPLQISTAQVCDDSTYLEQADDILSETLDKDLTSYNKKVQQKKREEQADE